MPSSIWFQTLSQEDRETLEVSDPLPPTADVAILGAGLVGLAAAYYLSAAGVANICVIDRAAPLAEASGANAGGLWFGQQSQELGPLFELAQASSRLYDGIVSGHDWQFDFRRGGVLELLYNEEDRARGSEKAEAIRRSGFRAETIGREELRRLEPAVGDGPLGAVHYPDEGQLHPAKFGAAIVRFLRRKGVKFCPFHDVLRAGKRIETARGHLDAGSTVIACGSWTPLVTEVLGWTPPIRPMRGQLLATAVQPAFLSHTVIAKRYYYWQLADGPLAGGGTVEDVGFERGTTPEAVDDIRDEMGAVLPCAKQWPTACAWSGFRPYCEDQMPVIGKVPGADGIYVAAGHYKKGVMLSPVTGKVIADLVTAGKTELPIGLLDPARFPRKP